MNREKKEHGHAILVQTANSCITQCMCCNEIQLQYKNIMLVFSWQALQEFQTRLLQAPSNQRFYVIEIIDIRGVPNISFGFSASGIFLASEELQELSSLIGKACERISLETIFRNKLCDN